MKSSTLSVFMQIGIVRVYEQEKSRAPAQISSAYPGI